MIDLSTRYLGLNLAHPLVPSASPLSRTLDGIKRLEDAGAPAIVMYSLFAEEVEFEPRSAGHAHEPRIGYERPEQYCELLNAAKRSTNIPILGSLNGTTPGAWLESARLMQAAGADALELNVYLIPTHTMITGAFVEERHLELLAEVRRLVTIPVSVKLGPFFSATANLAQKLTDGGAQGLVLFNRFFQPDIDIEQQTVYPSVVLSTSDELRLPLRWAAILYDHIAADIALSTGIHTHQDVIKGLMSGAKVTMTASELLQNGVERIGAIVAGLRVWMEEHRYESLSQIIGSVSQRNVSRPQAYVRANYMRVLDSWRGDRDWLDSAGDTLHDGLPTS